MILPIISGCKELRHGSLISGKNMHDVNNFLISCCVTMETLPMILHKLCVYRVYDIAPIGLNIMSQLSGSCDLHLMNNKEANE